jgi:hypothetical protein
MIRRKIKQQAQNISKKYELVLFYLLAGLSLGTAGIAARSYFLLAMSISLSGIGMYFLIELV